MPRVKPLLLPLKKPPLLLPSAHGNVKKSQKEKSVVVVFFGAAAETEEHIPGRPSMVQAVALEGGSGVQLPPVEAHSSSLELKSIDSIGVVPLSETGS